MDNTIVKNIEIITEEPKKILFLQQRQLGDVLLTTHAIARIKEKFPKAQLDYFLEKKCAPILENNPHITKMHLLDKEKQPTIFSQIAFYKEVAKDNYDTVISMQNLPRCLLQVFFSHAKYKLGLKGQWYKNLFYTHTNEQTSAYITEKKVDLLQPLEIIPSPNASRPQWFFSEQEKEEARTILKNANYDENTLLISMDVTHKDPSRRYPEKYYAHLVNAISTHFPNTLFFFIRGAGEEAQVEKCFQHLSRKDNILFPEKCPSIRLSAALMNEAKYHIGNDSFPRHLAFALNIPTSSLLNTGVSDWAYAYPDDKHKNFPMPFVCNFRCKRKKCTNTKCFQSLPPENIQEELIEHISTYTQKI